MIERIAQMHSWLRSATLDGTGHSVNLLMVDLDPSAAFAGQTTAVRAGMEIAKKAQRPLRILILKARPTGVDLGTVEEWLESQFGKSETPLLISYGDGLERIALAQDDLWVCTHWLTASVMSRYLETSDISANRVIYLIQDFEPAFSPWGTAYALAEETYAKGFIPLVNSRPLARYLQDYGHVPLAETHCFYPQINAASLEAASRNWTPDPAGRTRVLFYGRPGHSRNLYELGIASLKLWIARMSDEDLARLEISSAGTEHAPVDLGRGIYLESVGKLSLNDYYKLLSRVDVGLALMHSPHPGHLALELPTSGVPTVTNTFEQYRQSWHPLLELAVPTEEKIAESLEKSWSVAKNLTSHRFLVPDEARLGGSLEEVSGEVTALALGSSGISRHRVPEMRLNRVKLTDDYKLASARRAERITALLNENADLQRKLKTSLAASSKERSRAKVLEDKSGSLNRQMVSLGASNETLRSQVSAYAADIKAQRAEIAALRLSVKKRDSQLRKLNRLKAMWLVRTLLPAMRKGIKLRNSLRKAWTTPK